VVPLAEKKIEEVLKSTSPATRFADSTVDPEKFVANAVGLISVRGGEKRRHFRRVKAVPTEPGGGAAGAGNSMGEDAVKDSIAVSIS
jgi:hypothetical protein